MYAPGSDGAARTRDAGESGRNTAICSIAAPSQQAVRFHRLCERVHQLGPRPCAVAMIAIADGQDPIEVLEALARFDPDFVRYAGACDWPHAIVRVA